jgi:hypothetical protein
VSPVWQTGAGGERQNRKPFRNGPVFGLLDQGAANAVTLAGRHDAHLFDVTTSVDDVHQDVTDGLAGIVDGDPSPAIIGISCEFLDRSGLVVSYAVEPVFSVALPSDQLDVANCAQVNSGRLTDSHLVHNCYRLNPQRPTTALPISAACRLGGFGVGSAGAATAMVKPRSWSRSASRSATSFSYRAWPCEAA